MLSESPAAARLQVLAFHKSNAFRQAISVIINDHITTVKMWFEISYLLNYLRYQFYLF